MEAVQCSYIPVTGIMVSNVAGILVTDNMENRFMDTVMTVTLLLSYVLVYYIEILHLIFTHCYIII